jgi:urease alpha subunit
MSIEDFVYLNTNLGFDSIECEKCKDRAQFVRIFGTTSSNIIRSKEEILADVKEDARKMVEKIKLGDTKTILDVYGETT